MWEKIVSLKNAVGKSRMVSEVGCRRMRGGGTEVNNELMTGCSGSPKMNPVLVSLCLIISKVWEWWNEA